MSPTAKGSATPLAYWSVAAEDVGEDLFKLAELLVAAETSAHRRIKSLQGA
jgi:hypothetical protein